MQTNKIIPWFSYEYRTNKSTKLSLNLRSSIIMKHKLSSLWDYESARYSKVYCRYFNILLGMVMRESNSPRSNMIKENKSSQILWYAEDIEVIWMTKFDVENRKERSKVKKLGPKVIMDKTSLVPKSSNRRLSTLNWST